MFKTQDGTQIQLKEAPFAQGGEGKLFRIIAPSRYANSHLVKIYHAHKLSSKRQQKLQYLVKHPPVEISKQENSTVVWPQELLFDSKGAIVGFVMRLIAGEKLELLSRNKLPKGMDEIWWRFDLRHEEAWNLRLKLGYNLSLAVHHIHQNGNYILVDLKPDNVIVQPDGLLYLVDIDSIEVVNDGKTLFDAPVATPEYAPPEHYRKLDYDPTSRQCWDNFSLAIILYKLFMGVHPFAAANAGKYVQLMTLEEKIEAGLFVHAPSRKEFMKVVPPPHAAFKALPADLRTLFIQCFEAGHEVPEQRPAAINWAKTFRQLMDQSELKSAPQNTADYIQLKKVIFPSVKTQLEKFDQLSTQIQFKLPYHIREGIPSINKTVQEKIKAIYFPKVFLPPILWLFAVPVFFVVFLLVNMEFSHASGYIITGIVTFIVVFLICIAIAYYLYKDSPLHKRKKKIDSQLKSKKAYFNRKEKKLRPIIDELKSSAIQFSNKRFLKKAADEIEILNKQLDELDEEVAKLNKQCNKKLRKFQLEFNEETRKNPVYKDIPGNSIEEISVFLKRMDSKQKSLHQQLSKDIIEYKKAVLAQQQEFEEDYQFIVNKAESLLKTAKNQIAWERKELKKLINNSTKGYELQVIDEEVADLISVSREIQQLLYLKADFASLTFANYLFRSQDQL